MSSLRGGHRRCDCDKRHRTHKECRYKMKTARLQPCRKRSYDVLRGHCFYNLIVKTPPSLRTRNTCETGWPQPAIGKLFENFAPDLSYCTVEANNASQKSYPNAPTGASP